MNMTLDRLDDAALGEALRRCLAGLGDADAIADVTNEQLGAALRRQLPQTEPPDGPGFHRPGEDPDTVARRMGAALREWWAELQDDPGDRAALRRADALDEVAAVPAFHRLRWRIDKALDGRALSHAQRERLLLIAALAARLREDLSRPRGFVGQMAGDGADSAPVSALRFRRLLQATETPDLFRQLRRVLAMLDDRGDLLSLADAVLHWGESRRKRWAYDYYGIAPAHD